MSKKWLTVLFALGTSAGMASGARDPSPASGDVCPASNYVTNGQPFHQQGSNGGVTLNTALPFVTAEQLGDALFKQSAPSTNTFDWMARTKVALVVLDLFDQRLTVDSAERLSVDHGDLVVAHIRALIRGTKQFRPERTVVDPHGVVSFEYAPLAAPSSSLIVLPIALDEVESAKDFTAILDKTAVYLQRKLITRVVFNMSFNLMPCALAAASSSGDVKTYRAAVQAFLRRYTNDVPTTDSTEQDLRDLANAYRDVLLDLRLLNASSNVQRAVATRLASPQNAPFNTARRTARGLIAEGVATYLRSLVQFPNQLATPNVRGQAIYSAYVSASGNYGFQETSGLPALWPAILSVGAFDVNEKRENWSNIADVVSRGSWFGLGSASPASSLFSRSINIREQAALRYSGTSFTAPNLSVLFAMDLLRIKPRCVFPAVRSPTTGRLQPSGTVYASPLIGSVKDYRDANLPAKPCS